MEKASLTPRAWALSGATLGLASLAGCNGTNVNLDGLATALIMIMVILALPVVMAAVVLLMNVVAAGTGKGSAGWGVAGLVFGSLGLLVAVLSLGSGSKDEDVTILGVAAFLAAVPLCLLGWHNVKREKERKALEKQYEAARPPPPPPPTEPQPPTLAPPWP
jgi:hypothetical protein